MWFLVLNVALKREVICIGLPENRFSLLHNLLFYFVLKISISGSLDPCRQ
jgi:hypothetical protein